MSTKRQFKVLIERIGNVAAGQIVSGDKLGANLDYLLKVGAIEEVDADGNTVAQPQKSAPVPPSAPVQTSAPNPEHLHGFFADLFSGHFKALLEDLKRELPPLIAPHLVPAIIEHAVPSIENAVDSAVEQHLPGAVGQFATGLVNDQIEQAVARGLDRVLPSGVPINLPPDAVIPTGTGQPGATPVTDAAKDTKVQGAPKTS
jgi:hypothetical protein